MTMLEMVKRFPEQIREAMEIGKAGQIKPGHDVSKVYVTGMGGSGIGADFVSSFIRKECKVPYLVSKNYEAPAYVDGSTVVIASSYSGNTEETISNLSQCVASGSRIICVASGGKIISLAQEKGYEHIRVPDNWASPRACLGYSLVAQLYILNKLGLIGKDFEKDLEAALQLMESETEAIVEKARHLASSLYGKKVIIYSTDRMEPVAVRFRQQINENAKRLCWHHVIPEMNHNELVGWRENLPDHAVVFLRSKDEHPRNQLRLDLTKDVVEHYCGSSIELYSKGISLMERSLYLVHLTDYVSVFLAEMNKVDAVEVRVIDQFKAALAGQA